MLKYEALEHKADLKIRAFGKDKKELFLNMMLGMFYSQKPKVRENSNIKREIRINSLDLSALLVDFLNEILYLSQTNKEVYLEIIFKRFNDNRLEAALLGQNAEGFGEEIKAATFHNLEIKQNKNWRATVLFDI